MTRVVAAPDRTEDARPERPWGRYAVYGEIASGGMATIDYGRLLGPHGFARPVAIKRLHPHFAKDPEFVTMFVDEARMSARLHHANVIPTLDVVEGPGELALVMEYVHGETLATLLDLARARDELVPVPVAVTLLAGVLHGLHAAHEAVDDRGAELRLVHRDVSPQNVLVGQDGVPRVLDFGVAKAIGRLRTTPSGEIKGKLAYIAPEQLCGAEVDRRADVYGASAVLWETLTGRQLFAGPNESVIVHAVLNQVVAAPSSETPDVSAALDRIVMRGLSRSADERFASAREMALALEREVGTVAQSQVSDWLQSLAGAELAARARLLQQMQHGVERGSRSTPERATAGVQGTRRLELDESAADADSAVFESAGRRRGRGFVLWLALGATVLGAAIWGLARGGAAPARSPRVEVASRPHAAPQPSAAAEPLPLPAAVPLGVVAGAPRMEPAAAASAASPAPAKAPLKRRTRQPSARSEKVKPARAAEPKSPARSTGDCVPPYVIDRDGVRHPKPECL